MRDGNLLIETAGYRLTLNHDRVPTFHSIVVIIKVGCGLLAFVTKRPPRWAKLLGLTVNITKSQKLYHDRSSLSIFAKSKTFRNSAAALPLVDTPVMYVDNKDK